MKKSPAVKRHKKALRQLQTVEVGGLKLWAKRSGVAAFRQMSPSMGEPRAAALTLVARARRVNKSTPGGVGIGELTDVLSVSENLATLQEAAGMPVAKKKAKSEPPPRTVPRPRTPKPQPTDD